MQIKEIALITVRTGCLPHAHTRKHELHCFVHGQGTFYNGRRVCQFASPKLYYSAPGMEHRIVTDQASRSVRFYYIQFIPHAIDQPLLRDAAALLTSGHTLTDAEAPAVFAGLEQRFAAGGPHQLQAAGHQLSAFLHDLCARRSASPQPSVNPHITRATAVLLDGVYGTMDIDILVDRLHLEKSYLIRLFKRHTGTTPMRYLSKRKIETAAYLLRNTDQQVYKIAEQLGFCDEFYFSRVFKNQIGVSPQSYRARPG